MRQIAQGLHVNTNRDIAEEFISKGYIKARVENQGSLLAISAQVYHLICEFLSISPQQEPHHQQELFNDIHKHISVAQLNDARMHVINGLLGTRSFHEHMFLCAKNMIETIVGNELAIQRNVGFSIQLPNDTSSLLAPHSDVWGSECSPFECVLWLPLVDCYNTKSIFYLPPDLDRVWRQKVGSFHSIDEIFEHIQADVIWPSVDYGEFLLFTPACLHGNRKNLESQTRWSFNLRFKGLFTPYAGKGFGDYFQPLTIRPASRIGMSFQFPTIHSDHEEST